MNKVKFVDSLMDKYELLFDNSPLGICITEIDGSINLNNTFCEMLGYSRNELHDAGWKDITYKEDIGKHHEIFDIYSTQSNEVKKVEKRFVKKDGTVIWTEVTSRLKNDDDGNPAFLVSMIQDISQNKSIIEKLHLNEARYKELFDNNPSPMWLNDISTLKFLMVNKAAVDHYGYSNDEFLNMTLKDIRPPEEIPELMKNLDGTDSTIQDSSTWPHRKKDGTIILVKISSHSIRLNGYAARVTMAIDVTEKIAVKQNLVTEAAKLKSIIESTSDTIFSVDKNYCYTSFNSAHSNMMKKVGNVTIELGINFLNYLPIEKEKLTAKAHIDKSLKGERISEFVLIGDDKRTQLCLEVLHNPVRDENGEVIGVSVFGKDVTVQKAVFEKVKQLSQAVEQSPVTILITDTDGNIQYGNQKAIELTGYNCEELLNNNPRIFNTGEKTKEDYEILWNTIKAGDEWKGEFHNKKKNGELFWESATISPIKNEAGEITNFLAVKEDITDRKKKEQELIAAKEKAEEINRIKSVFLANMSHELRTPLVGILGFADILFECLTDESEKTMAASILQSGKRLLNTLSSILSLSELETLKENIDLSLTNVNALCSDIIDFYKINSNNTNVELKTEFQSNTLELEINNRWLRETLNHLIKNSVNYTESGFILIRTCKRVEPISGNSFGVIEVVDTGIGIPKDKQEIIFEEFRQASEGHGRNFEGTGLGLTLAKKYLGLMNGTISVESEEGKGTKFILCFPIGIETKSETLIKIDADKADEVKRDFLEMVNPKIKNKRILLVEDDEISRVFLEKCLSKLYDLETVNTGEQAVKVSTENKFDLILMDINLGTKMDGITTVQIIRKIDGYEKTPIVAMTAFASEDDKKEFLSKGCSHYISKPFLMKEIVELIENIFYEKEEVLNN